MTRPDPAREAFFVGFLAPPRALARFLGVVALALVALFAGLGWLVAATQGDPGDGAFRFDLGRQTVTGVLEARPYPMLHVLESERFPAGHTLLLSGQGKRGVQARAEALDGQVVTASGVLLRRGALDMLQLRGGTNGLAAAEGDGARPEPVPLGRWRLTGEICDGKCYAGAMRPGTGLAHKACANLCLIGGVPPVLVTTAEIAGSRFLMLADAEGGPVTDQVLDRTALLIEAEGAVERRGDLLVFRLDPATLRAVP
ncbi:MAG: hypothetical protein AAGC57_14605 [Pseudomonadota bacterium]